MTVPGDSFFLHHRAMDTLPSFPSDFVWGAATSAYQIEGTRQMTRDLGIFQDTQESYQATFQVVLDQAAPADLRARRRDGPAVAG